MYCKYRRLNEKLLRHQTKPLIQSGYKQKNGQQIQKFILSLIKKVVLITKSTHDRPRLNMQKSCQYQQNLDLL